MSFLAAALLPIALIAQTPAPRSAADSLGAARAAFSHAGQALQRDDLAAGRSAIDTAVSLWPAQPRYHWNAAHFAAIAGDTSNVLRHLAAYADLGLGRDLRADTTFDRYRNVRGFAAVEHTHDVNRASAVHSAPRVTMPDSTFWPEGMDVDGRSGTIYLASMRHGTIAAITNDGQIRELLPRDVPGFGSVIGVRVDTAHDFLYATVGGLPNAKMFVPADSSTAALLKIRISDGAILRRWDLAAAPGGHVLGDVYVAANGDVYTTDSLQPVVYRLRPGADTLEKITNPLFQNLQGMAVSPDGKYLYLSDYLVGIMRVDLATNRAIRLADAPHSTSIGCDGIVLYHGSVIAVQNGVVPPRVVRFTLSKDGASITHVAVLDQNIDVAIEPTIGALHGSEYLYVANSQWDDHNDDGSVRAGATLRKPVILSIPLVQK